MTSHTDLVARLRSLCNDKDNMPRMSTEFIRNIRVFDVTEAADLIEAQAAEIEQLRSLLEPPRSVCSCVIEMASFRHKGETCPHCGGVIG